MMMREKSSDCGIQCLLLGRRSGFLACAFNQAPSPLSLCSRCAGLHVGSFTSGLVRADLAERMVDLELLLWLLSVTTFSCFARWGRRLEYLGPEQGHLQV